MIVFNQMRSANLLLLVLPSIVVAAAILGDSQHQKENQTISIRNIFAINKQVIK
jgi:hypothetical protein